LRRRVGNIRYAWNVVNREDLVKIYACIAMMW